jgi:hypothetical protein
MLTNGIGFRGHAPPLVDVQLEGENERVAYLALGWQTQRSESAGKSWRSWRSTGWGKVWARLRCTCWLPLAMIRDCRRRLGRVCRHDQTLRSLPSRTLQTGWDGMEWGTTGHCHLTTESLSELSEAEAACKRTTQ